MRFTKQKKLREAYLSFKKKGVTKFLWFPLSIDGEIRWLETATIEYKVVKKTNSFLLGYYYDWKAIEFINK